MNQRHPIDDLFHQHLSNASIEPAPDMWSRIAAERKRRRNKKWRLAGGLSFLALALITGIALFVMKGDQLSVSQEQQAIASFDHDHQQTKETTTASTAHFENSPESSNVNTSAAQSDHNQQKNSSSTLTTANIISGASVAQSQNTFSDEALSNPASHNTITGQASTANDFSASPTAQAHNASTAVTKQQTEEENSFATNLVAAQIDADTETSIDEFEVSEMTELLDDSALSSQNKTDAIVGPHQRRKEYRVELLPTYKFNLESDLQQRLFASQAPKCARFTGSFLKFDLEVLAGPAYASSILEAKSTESVAHLNQRKNSEQPRVSFSEGFRIAATTPSGLGFRTGLISTRINERFKHYEGMMVSSRFDTIFDAQDQVISVDTVVFNEEIYATATNHIDFIEIPLLLTYETQLGKFRVSVNGGAYLNVAFDAYGQILSPADDNPVDFGQEGESNVLPVFRPKAGAAWYGSVALVYNLHSRYSLMAEPYFKSYPKGLANPEYGLTQNYLVTGLQLGMRMRL